MGAVDARKIKVFLGRSVTQTQSVSEVAQKGDKEIRKDEGYNKAEILTEK